MAFRPKIIIVEDDPSSLQLMGDVLGRMGAEARLLGNPVQAARLIEREKFDGAFIDLRMPEMDGIELARRIRRSHSNSRIPIVMITGVGAGVVKDSFGVGVNFYLQKPVTIERLRNLLNATRGSMLAERRRYQRAPVKLWVRVKWEGGQPSSTSSGQAPIASGQASGHTVNLSSDGMLGSFPQPLQEGIEVETEFQLPEAAEIFRIPARVSRVSPGPAPGETEGFGVALRFRHSQRKEREQITEFVDKTLAALAPDS